MAVRDILLVVDVQNDFCPGGALPVHHGDQVVPVINGIMDRFYRVAATQDWHPRNHMSFASNNPGKKPYDQITLGGINQVLWPDHCVPGTVGASFHSDLRTDRFDLVIRKGTHPMVDSYSAFLENDKKLKTGLDGYIRSMEPDGVYITGLATDYCVFYSAMDSASLGFKTYVIIDACRGIDIPENNIRLATETMEKNGIMILTTDML
jgi:nicotinamidase/pyrazinamidase